MKILVAAASKYGSTREIADAIAASLRERGHDITVSAIESAPDPAAFDACVLGSAIYMGHWMRPAVEYVQRNGAALTARPVWLFSSGPLGDPPFPPEENVDVTAIIAATNSREHRVFTGALRRRDLHFADKAMVMALRAPEGDFRPWDAIRAWAGGIADELDRAGQRETA